MTHFCPFSPSIWVISPPTNRKRSRARAQISEEARRGESATSWGFRDFLKKKRLPDLPWWFDSLPVLGYIVAGDGLIVAGGLKLMGFGCFGACVWVLCSGSRWVTGWVFGRFRWVFDLRWVWVGCRVVSDEFGGQLVVVLEDFWSILMVLVVGLYCLFITHNNNK